MADNTHFIQPPYTIVRIDIAHDEDWFDPCPALLDEEAKPIDLTGKTLSLFIRPVYDHTVLIKKLSSGAEGGIQIDSAPNGYFTITLPQAQVAQIPIGVWDQFLVLSQTAEPKEREVWRGQLVVSTGRRA